MKQIQTNAVEKLCREHQAYKGDKYTEIMKGAVLDALLCFCKQNAEFADAIMVEDKIFAGAMGAVKRAIKGHGIADIEAYRAAVSYYFPGAQIDYVMNIRMSEFEEPKNEPKIENKKENKKAQILSINLSDFF